MNTMHLTIRKLSRKSWQLTFSSSAMAIFFHFIFGNCCPDAAAPVGWLLFSPSFSSTIWAVMSGILPSLWEVPSSKVTLEPSHLAPATLPAKHHMHMMLIWCLIASASPSCKSKLMTCDNNASEYSQKHELPCRLDALHISFGKEATWVQLHWSLLGGLCKHGCLRTHLLDSIGSSPFNSVVQLDKRMQVELLDYVPKAGWA